MAGFILGGKVSTRALMRRWFSGMPYRSSIRAWISLPSSPLGLITAQLEQLRDPAGEEHLNVRSFFGRLNGRREAPPASPSRRR